MVLTTFWLVFLTYRVAVATPTHPTVESVLGHHSHQPENAWLQATPVIPCEGKVSGAGTNRFHEGPLLTN